MNRSLSLIVILLLCSLYAGFSQTRAEQIDSLSKLLELEEDQTKSLSLAVDTLYLYSITNPSDSLNRIKGYDLVDACQNLLDIGADTLSEIGTKTLRYIQAKALSIIEQSNEWYYRNNEALDNLDKMIDIYQLYQDSSQLSTSYYYQGRIYMTIPNFEKAMKSFNQALSTVVDEKWRGFILMDMAYVSTTSGDFESFLKYNKLCMESFEKSNSSSGKVNALVDLGSYYLVNGEYALSTETANEGLDLAYSIEDYYNVARCYDLLLNLSMYLEEYDKAISYADSMDVNFAKENFTSGVSVGKMERANIFLEMKDFEKVGSLVEELISESKRLEDQGSLASSYFMKAQMKEQEGQIDTALKYYHIAQDMFNELDLKPNEASSLQILGNLYNRKKDTRLAKKYSKKALDLGTQLGLFDIISHSSKLLYDIYIKEGNSRQAFLMLEQHIAARDTFEKKSNQKEFIKQEFQYAYEKQTLADSIKNAESLKVQEAEVETVNQRSNFLYALLALTVIFGGFIYNRLRITNRQKKIIEEQKRVVEIEKEKNEELLLNILPKETADELKEKGSVAAKSIDLVTVLFTDFKEFTEMSASLSPKDLVQEINDCFTAFDKIIEINDVEKIKTIGDSYMAAGGLYSSARNASNHVVQSALEMQEFMSKRKADHVAVGKPFFEMRVGIHTGPVVAGVVGIKKFQYDIWGDTVNIASRVESNSEVGTVNISKATFDMLDDDLKTLFKSRGYIPVKGKGEIEMFMLSD